MGAVSIWNGGAEFGYFTEKQLAPMMEGTTRPADFATVKPYLTKTQYSQPLLSKEKQDAMNAVRTDLDTYADEMRAKFILGDVPFTQWDTYVTTMKKMGIEKLEKMFQDSLDSALRGGKQELVQKEQEDRYGRTFLLLFPLRKE